MGGLMLDVSTSWSDDERSKFISGLQQFGSDWNRIARVVDSKTVQEVYEYASLHYKTMMTGKDLRSLESMQSGVSILSEQLKSTGDKLHGGVAGSTTLAALHHPGSMNHSPVDSDNDGVAKCHKGEQTPEPSTQNENCATHEINTTNESSLLPVDAKLLERSYLHTKIVPSSPVALPPSNRSRFEDKIKDLSDADIKMLLRKRLLDMQERRQESMLKRKQNEVYAAHQISAFQTRHGPSDPPAAGKTSSTYASKPAKAPLSKKRKQSASSSSSSTDFFAGVNALAMVSCEALQRFNLKYIRRGGAPTAADAPAHHASDAPDVDVQPRQRLLQTPASQQCSVPWDFSIAPKLDADKMDSAKRAKWSDDEHRQFLAGVEKHGRKWKKVQEHLPTKSRDQIRTHAYAHFAKTDKPTNSQGDVLEVAGFLSSLAQVPSPTSDAATLDAEVDAILAGARRDHLLDSKGRDHLLYSKGRI